MAVDPQKQRRILVVHGVQSGTNADQHQDQLIKALVTDRLNGAPLDFDTDMYRYEDLNDAAKQKFTDVLNLFLKNILEQKPIDLALDIVGDVLIALQDGSTARTIRQGLIDKIMEMYDAGNPVYVVAHSLGSIYAFDAVNELIARADVFDRSSRTTWPVQALVTIGSPIGLSMFGRGRVTRFRQGANAFRWYNHWDRTDPIISGSFYGKPQEGYDIAERFNAGDPDGGWSIQDRVMDTGQAWLAAHVGYWRNPAFGDDLVQIVTS